MVEGDVPHRGRLLFDSRIPARYCISCRWDTLAICYFHSSLIDALWRSPYLQCRGAREPARRRFDRDAREPSVALEGQAVRTCVARVRSYRFCYYYHSLSCRCHGPHTRESVCSKHTPGFGSSGLGHAIADPDPWCRFPEGL